MTIEHGILFSHASNSVADDLVAHGFRSAAAALVRADRVCRAAPGIEYEPMSRAGGGPWRLTAGLMAPEAISDRWSV